MILVDTDILIDFFRGVKEAENLLDKNKQEIIFSAISEAELLSGNECINTKKRENVMHLLSNFSKIPAGNPLVQVAGNIRREYGLEMPDAIIAASAITSNSILLTRNLKDFEKIKELTVKKPY